jgi:hypothetical protein
MKRRPPQIEVDRGDFATGVWWSASTTLVSELFVTSGYRRSRYAAVRSLECKLNQIRNEAGRLGAHANIVAARRGDFDVPTKEPA